MAGIAPGLDGYIAAQQLGQQRQQAETGALMQLLQVQNQMEQAAQAREMRPLQMEALRSQIATRSAAAQQAQRQQAAQGALSSLLATGGYQGALAAPTAVASNDAEALRMVQEAEAQGRPMGVNVPNPQNVKALTSMAFPAEFGKAQAAALFPKPTVAGAPVKVPDSTSPSGFRYVTREQALNMPAPSPQPAASVTVNNKQESEFGKTVGKEFGDIYTGAIKAEFAAPRTIANYERLGSLLSQVNTGKFTGTIQDMKAAAKAMGFDLNAMGVRDDVAPAQATRQISNMLALELRNPAGGAGMPGAMSDKDREFLVQSIPSMENDPAAIGKMIEYRKKLARRDQEIGKLAREYRNKNGRFDEGFFDELRVFAEANPLFPQTTTATPEQPASSGIRRYNPATGKIE